MAKLKFFEPEVEVITFDEKDVITASSEFSADDEGGGEDQIWPTSFN